jgi:tetratricopeptide (TPR) repeat protein
MPKWPGVLAPMVRRLTLGFVVLAAGGLTGCAGGVQGYIVSMRSHQGDLALQHGNLQDAALAYRLALQLDPTDQHARAGLAKVQTGLATKYYQASKFEDALAALTIAARYDPQSVRIAELRSEIEQARVNRAIVLSNYPTYRETGRQLRRGYLALKPLTARIILALQRFDYTYDSTQLSTAIRTSYTLGEEVTRSTNHLRLYRQLVEAGSPVGRGAEPLAPAASLLPLP